jgi:hypothetical protein
LPQENELIGHRILKLLPTDKIIIPSRKPKPTGSLISTYNKNPAESHQQHLTVWWQQCVLIKAYHKRPKWSESIRRFGIKIAGNRRRFLVFIKVLNMFRQLFVFALVVAVVFAARKSRIILKFIKSWKPWWKA